MRFRRRGQSELQLIADYIKREQACACSPVLSPGLSECDLHVFLLALLEDELAVLEVSFCD